MWRFIAPVYATLTSIAGYVLYVKSRNWNAEDTENVTTFCQAIDEGIQKGWANLRH